MSELDPQRLTSPLAELSRERRLEKRRGSRRNLAYAMLLGSVLFHLLLGYYLYSITFATRDVPDQAAINLELVRAPPPMAQQRLKPALARGSPAAGPKLASKPSLPNVSLASAAPAPNVRPVVNDSSSPSQSAGEGYSNSGSGENGGGGGNGNGGGRLIIGGPPNCGNGSLYLMMVTSQLKSVFSRHFEHDARKFNVDVTIWFNPSGSAQRAQLTRSTGDPDLDETIVGLLREINIGRTSPQCPQHFSIHINERSAGVLTTTTQSGDAEHTQSVSW